MTESKLSTWLHDAMRRRGYDPAPRSGGRSELARAASLAVPTVSRMLEQDGYVPGIDALRSVATVLGYTLGEALAASGLADPKELPIREDNNEPSDEGGKVLHNPRGIAILQGAIAGLQAELEAEDDPDERDAILGAISRLGGPLPPDMIPPARRERPGRRTG